MNDDLFSIWPWPIIFPPEKEDEIEHHYRRNRVSIPPEITYPVAPWQLPYTPLTRSVPYGGQDGILEINSAIRSADPNKTHGIPVGLTIPPWDGIPFNINDYPDLQVLRAILWPVGTSQLRGQAELYNTVQPFADELNPTPAEVEYWNYRVLIHFRALLGLSTPLVMNKCRSLQAQWLLEHIVNTAGINGVVFETVPPFEPLSCTDQIVYGGDECCQDTFTPYSIDTGSGNTWFNVISRNCRSLLNNGPQDPIFIKLTTSTTIGLAFTRRFDSGISIRTVFAFD